MLVSHVRVEERYFPPGSLAGTYDSNPIIVEKAPDDDNWSAWNDADGNKTILLDRMVGIVDFQIIRTLPEQNARLIERDSVLGTIAGILLLVPFNPHPSSVTGTGV